MRPGIRAQLQALGAELSPPMLQGTSKLLASLAAPPDSTVQITRDAQYGPDARNRLDLFRKAGPADTSASSAALPRSASASALAPVLVYVHGGGFVMGDKTSAGSPFYDNVGQWAAQQGWVGVTMTYRLAPQHRWPSGPEDIALAVRWLREHIAGHGGDPQQIFLMGQSAGAVHVAAYVAHQHFHGGAPSIAGAVLVSGIYDAVTQPQNPFGVAYYGEDPAVLAEARHTDGLLATAVPLLFSVSEFDPRDFQDQAMELAQAWHQQRGGYPPLEYLAGHNHLSPAQAIGSADDDLGPRVARFIATFDQR